MNQSLLLFFFKYDEHICLNMKSEKNVMQIRCFLKHKGGILALHPNQSAIALLCFPNSAQGPPHQTEGP